MPRCRRAKVLYNVDSVDGIYGVLHDPWQPKDQLRTHAANLSCPFVIQIFCGINTQSLDAVSPRPQAQPQLKHARRAINTTLKPAFATAQHASVADT